MPSIPGAPLLLLAIWYASCSVSILQTWMYSPQKRQVGSAFALTYRLRLRSCKLLAVFVSSPLPPLLLEPVTNSRAPSLHGHYSASPLLQTRPSPSRLSPTSLATPHGWNSGSTLLLSKSAALADTPCCLCPLERNREAGPCPTCLTVPSRTHTSS